MPAIIFGGILGGVVTPTEAAVLAVIYAFIVGVFVYREIKWTDLPRILVQSAVVTAAVGFLLGTAAVVAWVLAVQQIPQLLLTRCSRCPAATSCSSVSPRCSSSCSVRCWRGCPRW